MEFRLENLLIISIIKSTTKINNQLKLCSRFFPNQLILSKIWIRKLKLKLLLKSQLNQKVSSNRLLLYKFRNSSLKRPIQLIMKDIRIITFKQIDNPKVCSPKQDPSLVGRDFSSPEVFLLRKSPTIKTKPSLSQVSSPIK